MHMHVYSQISSPPISSLLVVNLQSAWDYTRLVLACISIKLCSLCVSACFG